MGMWTGFHFGSTPRVSWYVRIALYATILLGTAFGLNRLRGRIPQAFGLTPIRVEVLSLERFRDRDLRGGKENTFGVVARITGRKSPFASVSLRQFVLKTESGQLVRPYASSLQFDHLGNLAIAHADTFTGVFLFSVPSNEKPSEFWWNP